MPYLKYSATTIPIPLPSRTVTALTCAPTTPAPVGGAGESVGTDAGQATKSAAHGICRIVPGTFIFMSIRNKFMFNIHAYRVAPPECDCKLITTNIIIPLGRPLTTFWFSVPGASHDSKFLHAGQCNEWRPCDPGLYQLFKKR
jgi:hypothetical protein